MELKKLTQTPRVIPTDLEDLPQEVVDNLGFSDADKLEFQIVNAIDRNGGTASIDKIMIILFNEHGHNHKRKSIASRIYRMTSKEMIFKSDLGKGIYTTAMLVKEPL